MEEVKLEESALNADKHTFLKEVKKLKTDHEKLSTKHINTEVNQNILNKLFESKIIDRQGNPLPSKP